MKIEILVGVVVMYTSYNAQEIANNYDLSQTILQLFRKATILAIPMQA